jgi:hypothetical protein
MMLEVLFFYLVSIERILDIIALKRMKLNISKIKIYLIKMIMKTITVVQNNINKFLRSLLLLFEAFCFKYINVLYLLPTFTTLHRI